MYSTHLEYVFPFIGPWRSSARNPDQGSCRRRNPNCQGPWECRSSAWTCVFGASLQVLYFWLFLFNRCFGRHRPLDILTSRSRRQFQPPPHPSAQPPTLGVRRSERLSSCQHFCSCLKKSSRRKCVAHIGRKKRESTLTTGRKYQSAVFRNVIQWT